MTTAPRRTPLRRDARVIDGISLREVDQVAAQKNASGLQYHFGTKADLIAAVFRRRQPEIEARRDAMLKQMKAAGGMSDLRQVLNAMVLPFAKQLDSGRNQRSYVRFVAQLYSHPSIREADFASHGFRETFRAADRLLSAEFPPRLVRQRLGLLIGTSSTRSPILEGRLSGRAARHGWCVDRTHFARHGGPSATA